MIAAVPVVVRQLMTGSSTHLEPSPSSLKVTDTDTFGEVHWIAVLCGDRSGWGMLGHEVIGSKGWCWMRCSGEGMGV